MVTYSPVIGTNLEEQFVSEPAHLRPKSTERVSYSPVLGTNPDGQFHPEPTYAEYTSGFGTTPAGSTTRPSSQPSARSSEEDIERSDGEGLSKEPINQKKSWRFLGTFGCLAVLNFVCAIDATILSVALPNIAEALGATAIQAFWCATSFLLCACAFQPTWAAFSDIFGRKPVILSALMFFTIGSFVTATAQNITAMLVGRCIQGVGGGGLVALTYVIMADMVTLAERGKWQSIISLQWAIGTVIGPVVGGALAKVAWRWIFWMNIPFCVIGGIGVPICLKLAPKEGSMIAKLKAFDWFGSFLFIAATTSVLIPLTWGGVMYDWNSARTLVPLLLGVAGLVVFVVYSVYISKQPLIRRSLFNSPTAIIAYFGTLILGIIIWAMLFYLPLYFEVGKGYSPIKSGIAVFPITFTTAPTAVIIGVVITKTGHYRPSLVAGWIIATIGVCLLIILQETTSTPGWIFISFVPGIGLGILFSAQAFATQASVATVDIPNAGAMYSFFRAFGQTIGVAISGVIFQNGFKNKLLETDYAVNAEAWSRDASSIVQAIQSWSDVGAEGEMKAVVVKAYVESLRMVWVVMSILAIIAMLASFLGVKEIAMSREIASDQAFDNGYKKGNNNRKSGIRLDTMPEGGEF